MNHRPTISERNAVNARAALDQYASALRRHVMYFYLYTEQDRIRSSARLVLAEGVLLELLGVR